MVGRPYVIANCAVSLDGCLDDDSPDRLLLSNEADFDRVDALRASCDAILVGAGTVRSDRPRLLVRSADRGAARVASGRPASPLRVVLSSFPVELPPGAETVVLNGPLEQVLDELAARGVRRLLVEGGASVLHAFLRAGLVDELTVAVAPLLIGSGPRLTGPGPALRLRSADRLGEVAVLSYAVDELPQADDLLALAVSLADRCPPSDTAFSVGAVVASASGEVLSVGWSRQRHPADHAEEAALAALDPFDPRLAGATVYSSLEPCSTRASRPRTCTELILAAGVRRVVFAWREPAVFVDCDGAERLRTAGVEVVERPEYADAARRPNLHLF